MTIKELMAEARRRNSPLIKLIKTTKPSPSDMWEKEDFK